MNIEVKNYVIYYTLSDKIIEFIIDAKSKLAIRDTEPTTKKQEEYTRENENGETVTERYEVTVVDTSLITADEYKKGYTEGLAHCNNNDIKFKWLDLYKDQAWYETEKTALTNSLALSAAEQARQDAINSNFEYNGKTYYGDQRGREAILGTTLIGCVYIIKNLLTAEQITQFNNAIQLPYSDVNGVQVKFGVADFFDFAIKYMEHQQAATLGLTTEKK